MVSFIMPKESIKLDGKHQANSDGSSGLVVQGVDSCSEGREFESELWMDIFHIYLL